MEEQVIGYELKVKGTETTKKQIDGISSSLLGMFTQLDTLLKKMESTFGKDRLADLAQLTGKLNQLKTEQEKLGKGSKKDDTERAKRTKVQVESLEDLLKKLEALRKQEGTRGKQAQVINKILKAGYEDQEELLEQLTDDLANIKNEQRKVTQAVKDQQREYEKLDAATGSYRELNATLVQLRRQYKELGATQREAELGQDLLAQIAALDSELKELDAGMGQYQRNVGNYLSVWEGMPGVLGDAGQGIQGVNAAFKTLAANPIIAVLAVLVAGLTALFKLFQQTESGATLFAKASGALQGVMSGLVGIVDRLASFLGRLFKDPLGGLQDFGKALVQNIINRFTGLIKLVQATGQSLGNLVKGDFKALKESAQEAGEAITQIGTGLTPSDVARIKQGLNDLTQGVVQTTQAFAALAEQQRQVERANVELTRSAELLTTEEEKLNAIADDATRSFQEREQAAEAARVATERRAQVEIQLAQNTLGLLNQELALRRRNGEDTLELEKERAGALQGVLQAERDLLLSQLDNEKVRRELTQDRLERDLDILIDGLDNQKTINERLIANDKLTLEERQALQNETERLAQESFDKQIETIQQFTGETVDANALLSESNATLLNERIRELGLSEIIEGRLLEVIRDRRTAIQDLKESQQGLDAATQESLASALEITSDQVLNIQRIKLEQGLIIQEEFAAKQVQIQIDQIQEELRILELKEDERQKKQMELALLRAQQINLDFQKELALLEQNEEKRTAQAALKELERQEVLRASRAAGAISDAELEAQQQQLADETSRLRQEEELAFLQRKLELARQFGLDTLLIQQEIAEKELDIVRGKNERLLENERRTQEARDALVGVQLDTLSSFVGITQDLLSKDEETRKKFGAALKGLALGEIAINLARELSAINANPAVNADLTQSTRVLLSAAAIARSIVAGIKVTQQQFAEGGAIELESTPSGVLNGPSHSQGGMSFVDQSGNLYEMEGNEFFLNTGREALIVNKNSTRFWAPVLQALARTPGSNRAKRQIASIINQDRGGRRFAEGGAIGFNFPAAVPVPLQAPNFGQGSDTSGIEQSIEGQTQAILGVVKTMQGQMSGMGAQVRALKVYANPREIYQQGRKQSTKKVRAL